MPRGSSAIGTDRTGPTRSARRRGCCHPYRFIWRNWHAALAACSASRYRQSSGDLTPVDTRGLSGSASKDLFEDPVHARSVQRHAPVDDDVLPGDETCQIRAQKNHYVAISSGCPMRASGVVRSYRARSWGRNCNKGSVRAVRIIPGETELSRILRTVLRAADAVIAATPALAAAYGASPDAGLVPLMDAVETTLPPPAARICGMAAPQLLTGPSP